MSSHSPVGSRDVGLWVADCADAFGAIKYLEITRCQQGETSDAMIDVQATVNLPVEDWQYVRADCEKIWGEDLAAGLRAIHSTSLKETTLTFSFICLNGVGEYVTGRLRGKLVR